MRFKRTWQVQDIWKHLGHSHFITDNMKEVIIVVIVFVAVQLWI